jgi:hypothetical protein
MILLVIGFMIPGLMYILLGLKTLRKDWLAMEEWFLVLPLAFIMVYFLSFGGYMDYFYPDSDLIWLGVLILVGIIIVYMWDLGQIVVFHGERDVVIQAIQRILENRGLSYRMEVDTFTIPEINMEIEVNHFERSYLVGISTKSKDKEWIDTIHEDILNMFKGRPSERPNPGLLILGSGIVVIGLALGVASAIG